MNITIAHQTWQVQFEIMWFYGSHVGAYCHGGQHITLCWN